MLFRFLRTVKIIPRRFNRLNRAYSKLEIAENTVATGLEEGFSSCLPITSLRKRRTDDFEKCNAGGISRCGVRIAGSSPGPDELTTKMLKLFFEVAAKVLLEAINYSLSNAWISSTRSTTAKVIYHELKIKAEGTLFTTFGLLR